MIILDACVLIAFANPADRHHNAAVAVLDSPEPLAISALTGAEVMVHPPTAAQSAWRQFFAELGITVLALGEADMAPLAETRRRTGLKMPDAIVLYLAKRESASLATFDTRLVQAAAAQSISTQPRG
ncbi:MAG: PIN domain-containing protein [Bifidobacteriaceae bacterium]|jgi:predicted nucleic acid-binding protein|nr:PIN domain-containing protein [Bifidobacteriaceae bacterium]